MAHGQNDAREATASGEGALAKERAACAATAALLQEAQKAHVRRYGERDTRTGDREEGKQRKARKGSQRTEVLGTAHKDGARIHLLTYLGQSL